MVSSLTNHRLMQNPSELIVSFYAAFFLNMNEESCNMIDKNTYKMISPRRQRSNFGNREN